ncbi:SH2 domain-containing adapter protein D [Protopterus annectens]|uniref:SH2 domain-containing adapter protein D n=1 Tax=Protopterus annectens TaxID=7888 RepID=UPI001CF9B3D2|nr:SH2 domain-containing adapter protein D [Protopterus annectens]
MAKWLKDYLTFGGKRIPPQPPKPDYKESEILKAYRAQKSLDFEDPYENLGTKVKSEGEQGIPGSPFKTGGVEIKYVSPKHRLIKVDSTDLKRSKILTTTDEISCKQEQVDPDSEYSDPFDFQNESGVERTEEGKPESNGYMEPYEAQRVLTDLQRKGEKKQRKGSRDRKGVQLYDIPYEESSGDSEPEGVILQKSRESRLPRDDERPADEYDQPWEWKKDHISKAFAGN